MRLLNNLRTLCSFLLVLLILQLSSCYSFKGISIPPDVNTFYITDVIVKPTNAPVNLDLDFFEALQTKIRNESKLIYTEDDPDLIISPVIERLSLSSAAPQEGNTTALNRYEMVIRINLENAINEEESFSKSYSEFQDFDATENLTLLEEGLVDNIFLEITERFFNDAFTNW